MVPTM
ncbi:hypothetical protein YQE_00235, partial [Dendroctonus ponderosae]